MKTTVTPPAAQSLGHYITRNVNSVTTLTVATGTYAQISYGITGEMSINLSDPADPVASLFAAADAEMEHASQIKRRAMVMRAAAWHLSKERKAVEASQLVNA